MSIFARTITRYSKLCFIWLLYFTVLTGVFKFKLISEFHRADCTEMEMSLRKFRPIWKCQDESERKDYSCEKIRRSKKAHKASRWTERMSRRKLTCPLYRLYYTSFALSFSLTNSLSLSLFRQYNFSIIFIRVLLKNLSIKPFARPISLKRLCLSFLLDHTLHYTS